ncbi:laccase isoform X2 [Orussus abietinus]|uniref:laccase isoform X2 n=1 Tax=Orussus abietinus TaxID=222816 RepID=UPI0006269781|nr:laccase isoform X2 [Orussus abietinus]
MSVCFEQFNTRLLLKRFSIIILIFLGFFHSSTAQQSDEWSRPEECIRTCKSDQPPKTCYYHFRLEYYTSYGRACELCSSNVTNQLTSIPWCQCVEGDGIEKTIFSINRMLPGPSIQVCLHDNIIIDVENDIEGVEVTLHWHGLFQNGFQYYDGVPQLTQCPITSRTTFRYQFTAQNAGTHFYHSHVAVHKIDGQYGSLIIREPVSEDPHGSLFDFDLPTHVIVLSDYMHYLSMEKLPGLFRNPQFRGQSPDDILINGRGRFMDPNTNTTTTTPVEVFQVKPGKRYRFRVINSFSTVCLAEFAVEGHTLQLIAQDGENVEPRLVNTIITGSGERVDFILTANQTTTAYWIQVRGLGECQEKRVGQLAILTYSANVQMPNSPPPGYFQGLSQGILYNPLDSECNTEQQGSICYNQLRAANEVDKEYYKVEPDYRFALPFAIYSYNSTQNTFFRGNNYKQFFVDGISYQSPPGPPISQHVQTPICNRNKLPENCSDPCNCFHVLPVKLNSMVEVIIYDQDPQPDLYHPFHLHGYAFKVFDVGRFTDGRKISKNDINSVIQRHVKKLKSNGYHRPSGKDTVVVPNGGWVIFRFKADNPGWWFYHCHFTWHTAVGMDLAFQVGEAHDLPPVPRGFPRCNNFQPPPMFGSDY